MRWRRPWMLSFRLLTSFSRVSSWRDHSSFSCWIRLQNKAMLEITYQRPQHIDAKNNTPIRDLNTSMLKKKTIDPRPQQINAKNSTPTKKPQHIIWLSSSLMTLIVHSYTLLKTYTILYNLTNHTTGSTVISVVYQPLCLTSGLFCLVKLQGTRVISCLQGW